VDPERQLRSGLDALALEVPDAAIGKLLAYAALLREWSTAYNLVAAGDRDKLLPRHLLDSLSVAPHLQPGSLLDIGCGAGLPGVPLAVIDPAREVTLIDAAGKKIRFIRHVARELELTNIRPLQQRIETLQPGRAFANIICRAFAPLAAFVSAARPFADAQTRLLAMKGNYPRDELEELPARVNVEAVEPLTVPDLHAQRHLVIMTLPRQGAEENDGETWQESSQ
jgi:16S rRNA (guanine527-N7)-methyltransferase